MEITRLEPKRRLGLVVVLTGYGKGKTTSALGMVLRAVGHGLRVCVIQFMKGDLYSGEWDGVKLLGDQVVLHVTGKGFCGIQGNPYPFAEHRRNAQDAFGLAEQTMRAGRFDLLILDEINNAVHLGLVDLPQVLHLLAERPAALHLVLTGRDAHEEVIDRADTVSRIDEVKHAYRRDIEPQPGIDY